MLNSSSQREHVYSSRNTKNKNIIKYTLKKLMSNRSNGISIDFDSMTIEHIIPESVEKNKTLEFGVGSIGNLILVDKSTNNNELRDSPFAQKKEILIKKNYPLEKYITEQKIWTEIQIKERTEILAKIMYNEVAKI